MKMLKTGQSNIAYFDNKGELIYVSPRKDQACTYGVISNSSEENNKKGIPAHVSMTQQELFDERETAYHADIIVCRGNSYHLSNPVDVKDIPTPEFVVTTPAVLELSYIMKIRCGAEDNCKIIPSLVEKTLELMRASKMIWRRADYLQVIRNYYRCNMFAEGGRFEAEYRKRNQPLFDGVIDRVQEGMHLSTKYYYENKNRRSEEYEKVKKLCPDLAPATIKGYLQIRTRGTARFNKIRSICESEGMSFNLSDNMHYCEVKKTEVEISTKYDHSGRTPVMKACMCSLYKLGMCKTGVDENGLSCIYVED